MPGKDACCWSASPEGCKLVFIVLFDREKRRPKGATLSIPQRSGKLKFERKTAHCFRQCAVCLQNLDQQGEDHGGQKAGDHQ